MASERLRRIVTVASLITGGVAAQNVTVPAAMNGVEGGGGTNIPFGSNQACRYQCIYDAEELPWSGPRVITGLLLRADNNTPMTAMPAKGFLEVSVLVSTTAKDSATMSPVFADNYGTDATWVVQNQIVQLPAQPPMPAGPRPANIPFVFTVPWVYGLTPAVQGLPAPDNLLVEILIHLQPSGLYRIDNLGSCTAQATTFGQVGPLCTFGPQPVALTGDTSMLAGSSYSWQLSNAPPSVPFLVGLDLVNSGGLFGNPAWPLPYPMFDPANPSSPSAALAGLNGSAPDCWLNVNMPAMLSGVTDAQGLGAVSLALPAGRQYLGTTVYAQALVFAPTVNPMWFITSRGYSSTVCGPRGVARNFAFFNNSGVPLPPPPTSGAIQYGVGMIFDVQ